MKYHYSVVLIKTVVLPLWMDFLYLNLKDYSGFIPWRPNLSVGSENSICCNLLPLHCSLFSKPKSFLLFCKVLDYIIIALQKGWC